MPPIEIDIIGRGSKTLPLKENEKQIVGEQTVVINKITYGRKGLIKDVELTVGHESAKRLQYNRIKTSWRTHRAAIMLSDRTLVYTRLIKERNRGPKQK